MVSVLLVDDSEYFRDLLAALLLGAGHKVVGEATSGDEAVEKYQKLTPEVVLMDIVLELGNTSKTGNRCSKRNPNFRSPSKHYHM